MAEAGYDVHRLDSDGDGEACEGCRVTVPTLSLGRYFYWGKRDRMKVGDDVVGTLLEPLSENTWRVRCAEFPADAPAVLNSRSGKLYQAGDEERLWIYDIQHPALAFRLSDSGFGRLPISDRMRPRYIRSLQSVISLLSSPEHNDPIDPSDLSEVKGILNRCVRKDQCDWLTVYDALGRPHLSMLRKAATALGYLARAYRNQDDETAR